MVFCQEYLFNFYFFDFSYLVVKNFGNLFFHYSLICNSKNFLQMDLNFFSINFLDLVPNFLIFSSILRVNYVFNFSS